MVVMGAMKKPELENEVFEATQKTPYCEEGEKFTRPILFARALFHHHNGWLALEQAGYNYTTPGAKETACWKLKTRDDVQAELKRLRKLLEKQVILSVAELDQQVIDLSKADMQQFVDADGNIIPLHKLPRSLTMAVQEYQTDTTYDSDGNKHVKTKLKLVPKKELNELLMRRKNLLKGASDGSEVRVRLSFGKGAKKSK